MSTSIAIFASGRGSGFQSIVDAIAAGKLDARIVALVTDKPEALVVERAKKAGVPVVAVPPPSAGVIPPPTAAALAAPTAAAERRRLHEEQILKALKPYQPRFLVLAGYMRVLTSHLIEAYRCERGYTRIVNVHPSLLPAFPGVGAYAQAFAYGTQVAGATVHLVELAVDSGPICAQEAFSIADCNDAHEVEARGLAIEHRLYPEALNWILPEKFQYQPPTAESGRGVIRRDVRRGD